MTCIIGMVQNNKVSMIGDKEGSDGFTKNIFSKTPKVFHVGDFILGYTTSFRMGQILQYSWTPPKKSLDDNDDYYIYKIVVDSIKKCFEDNGFGHKPKAELETGNFLIGWNGRLFEMQSNLSLMEHSEFASVGCGCYHATAAMKTMKLLGFMEDEYPEVIMQKALLVAANSVTGVSEEYDFVEEKK